MKYFYNEILPALLTSALIGVITFIIAYVEGYIKDKKIKELESRVKRLEELHKHDAEVLNTIIKESGFLEESDIEWALTNQLISIYINEGLNKDLAEIKAKEKATKIAKSLTDEVEK